MRKTLFLILFLSFSIYCSHAQKRFSDIGNWKGDVSSIKIVSPGLDIPLVAIPNESWCLDASNKGINIYQDVSLEKTKGTLWCAFLAEKTKGNARFGLAFEKGKKENLFAAAEPLAKPLLIVVRIDYATNKAYIYQNPSLASVPDLENAECILSGDFSFDCIKVVAEKGCYGKICNILLGNNFQEVVSPRAVEMLSGEGDAQSIISWEKRNNALWLRTSGGTLCLQPYAFGGLHVMYGSEQEMGLKQSYAVKEQPQVADFEVSEDGENVILRSSLISASVNKRQGDITFLDRNGKLLLKEKPGKARKNMLNDSVNASCKFQLQDADALYGLGEFRDGLMNLRNAKRELVQFNTQAAVPVIYSTRGWGLFWDNPSRTVYTDNSLGMSFISDYGKIVDYYIFAGESMDSLVGTYRTLTGAVPMLPYWALGYHQSRNRYANQKEVLDVVHRMHKEEIPLSSVFIDYHYWGKYGTGAHRFDEELFPDVSQMLDSLHHTYDTKVVLTVWPSFKPGIPNYNDMSKNGYILEGAKAIDGYIYDPFNPLAAKMYWDKVSPLVKQNIDGWFLDGPEPDHVISFLPLNTYAGPASKVRNVYTVAHSSHFYAGLMKARSNERPYLLTRCAWASQQKYGTAVWSGDIPTTFRELQIQIAAGLNFTASGIPYWTTDIGGYSGGDPADNDYRELFVRWFQYGTFCPIFRSHGRRYPGDTKAPNELWAYGSEVQRICTDFIKLRYRLLPYIYTLTGKVTHDHYTPMRLLAFDFPEDEKVLDCKDQFMYGPSFLVCPIVQAGTTSRSVYLPAGHTWTDFWSNTSYQGGTTMEADAPINRMPLYVKSGSIIPCYSSVEKAINTTVPMEILVYGEEDGTFSLYEDDGTSMEYKNENYHAIPFKWIDKDNTFVIEEATGNYTISSRVFVIRLKGTGGKNDKVKTVNYTGQRMEVLF